MGLGRIIIGIVLVLGGSLGWYGLLYEDIDERDFSVLFNVERMKEKMINLVVIGVAVAIGAYLLGSGIKSYSS